MKEAIEASLRSTMTHIWHARRKQVLSFSDRFGFGLPVYCFRSALVFLACRECVLRNRLSFVQYIIVLCISLASTDSAREPWLSLCLNHRVIYSMY